MSYTDFNKNTLVEPVEPNDFNKNGLVDTTLVKEMAMSYTDFNKDTMSKDTLVDAILVQGSGIEIDKDSIVYQYGTYNDANGEAGSSISFYTSNATNDLAITNALLLSTGSGNPNSSNTAPNYSVDLSGVDGNQLKDADLENTAKLAFSGSGAIYDATVLEFNFEINNLFTHGIKFDLLFGSDEYPEYSDSEYVDIAAIYLNGENIALFNNNEEQPLSVISKNIEIGNFNDNTDGHIPIEYDGISNKLTVYAPVAPGVNTIKIAIGDTGDSALDSGLYVANFQGTQLSGSGLSSVIIGTSGDDKVDGTDDNETFETGEGDDVINPGYGDDVIISGLGNDTIYGSFGDNQIDGGAGIDKVIYDMNFDDTFVKIMDNDTVHVGKNSDNLLNVEEIVFNDMTLNVHDLLIQDDISKIYIAYFGRSADPQGMEYWLNQVNHDLNNGRSYSDSMFSVVSAFADSDEAEGIYTGIQNGSMNDEALNTFITSIYQNLFDRTPEKAGLDYWVNDGKSLQEHGINIGTIVKTVIDGAQNTPENLDRTFMQNKAQVAWDYTMHYQLHSDTVEWTEELHHLEAKNILNSVDADHLSVNNAYTHVLDFFG
jgi:hypothetical protein